MTVRDLGRGKWQIRVKKKNPVSGRWQEKTKVFQGSERAARSEEIRFRDSVEIVADDGTVGYVCEQHLKDLEKAGRSGGYLRNLRQYLEVINDTIGDKPLSQVRKPDIARFYSDLRAKGLARSTIAHYRSFLRPALQIAVDEGWIPVNPAVGVKLDPVQRPNLQVLTSEQVQKILDVAQKIESWQTYHFLYLAAVLSTRRGELCALRWSSFSGKNVTIAEAIAYDEDGHAFVKDTKTHGVRTLGLDQQTLDLVETHKRLQKEEARLVHTRLIKDPFLFSFEADGAEPARPDTFSKAFRRVVKKAKLSGVRLHDLRHYGATQAIAAGLPVSVVSYRLGHQKMSTTLDIYAHHQPGMDSLMSNFMGGTLQVQTDAADD